MPDDYDATTGIERRRPSSSSSSSGAAGAERGRVLGVGMGLPGPVHSTGVVGSSAILPGWAGTHAAERMSELLGMDVWLRNDANLGRARRGHLGRRAATPRRLVYLKLATGIGAGIVIDGRLFDGAGRHGRRDRPHLPRRDRRHLPLREPRLSRDLRERGGHRRTPQPQPRRAARPRRRDGARRRR